MPRTDAKPKSAPKAAAAAAAPDGPLITDPYEWIAKQTAIGTSRDVEVPRSLIDQVIGQDLAVAVAQKAASQKRHLLLIGDPGTGKSMIAKAMSEMLPPETLSDVLVYHNAKDPNQPLITTIEAGKGPDAIADLRRRAMRKKVVGRTIEWTLVVMLLGLGLYWFLARNDLMAFGLMLLVSLFMFMIFKQRKDPVVFAVPKLLMGHDPAKETHAAYVDATGSHAGALLGDVRHDPFQSGGLETPTHERVEVGAIHRAHKGILFIDEINVLRLDSQQALLTAMQDKKYAITGHSETSSGAMVRTQPVPCDFVLVAAGNLDVIAPTDNKHTGLHPALRSRIRGYGYEVYVKSVMEDTDANRRKLVRFVAQEVRRDGQIPHFDSAAVAEVIREAQRRSGHTGKLTLRLRELGGLVRTAGDLARDRDGDRVTVDDVLAAKRMSMSLEYQVTRRGIEVSTAKEALTVGGEKVGTAIGCAFLGTGETGEPAGIVVPVEADATISSNRNRGSLFVGGGLEREKTLQDNVGAILKRLRGSDMAGIDLHVQSLLQQEGADVGALGAAAAVAAVSSLETLPVRQDTAIIGALAVSGRLRAVEGVTQMIEGAADLGYTRAVVPAANKDDILLEHAYKGRIEVLLAGDLADALQHALVAPPTRKALLENALHRKPKK
jgi:Lon-like ATP-dependent protease